MEGEQAPIAPAPASEANQPTSAEPAVSEASTPIANIPADQIETFNKFISANGGFEKAFSKLKNDVSTQSASQPAYQEVQPQPAQQPQPQSQPQPQRMEVPQGYITQEEFAIQQYFGSLANEPEYAPIADKIRSGEVLKEMTKFNIRPASNGMFNDGQVRNFLGLLAKTVPATAPEPVVSNTPTVDYVATGDQITSQDEALSIIRQNMDLQARGIAPHPKTEEAKKFLKNSFGR